MGYLKQQKTKLEIEILFILIQVKKLIDMLLIITGNFYSISTDNFSGYVNIY